MGEYHSGETRVAAGKYAGQGDGDVPACQPGGPSSCVTLRAELPLNTDASRIKVALSYREERSRKWVACREGVAIAGGYGYFSPVRKDDGGIFLTVSVEFRNWRDDGARFVKMDLSW